MEWVTLEDFLQNKGAFEKATIVKQNDDEVCIAINDEDELFDLVVPKVENDNTSQADKQ